MQRRTTDLTEAAIVYLLLCSFLGTFSQRLFFHWFADAGHSLSLTVLDTQTQVFKLRNVVLTQSLILLTCVKEVVLY